jgi:hypothetical protein
MHLWATDALAEDDTTVGGRRGVDWHTYGRRSSGRRSRRPWRRVEDPVSWPGSARSASMCTSGVLAALAPNRLVNEVG